MSETHVGQLSLHRLRVGDLNSVESEEARAHTDQCAACRAKLKSLEEEQARFEQAISFERFEAGVQRSRRQREIRPPPRWLYPVMSVAAAAMITVVARPLLAGGNRTKGGADVVLRVAGPKEGPQRIAPVDTPEVLSPGERIRIGYHPGERRYFAAVSIDEKGEVTPLYPESGASLPAEEGPQTHYLPGSLEFFGKGVERVVVVLSDSPLQVDQLKQAARRAYDEAHGDVLRMPPLRVPGEQFPRNLLKP